MSQLGFSAAPMSRANIRNTANDVRKLFGVPNTPRFPLLNVLENGLPQLVPEAVFEVVEPAEMRGMYAEALPDAMVIRVREDVYLRACNGVARDLFTLAHELGHLVLHMDRRLHRLAMPMKLERYRDPEWQADAFAGELLMPVHLYKQLENPEDACTVFGVSKQACEIQVRAWVREGII